MTRDDTAQAPFYRRPAITGSFLLDIANIPLYGQHIACNCRRLQLSMLGNKWCRHRAKHKGL
jgi:hypothetical protein